ncbi:hypothetical protein [Clostridium massiliamazoniense]|nr:hypothetical protein [Clostridium massiliamazoniense]
MNILKINKINNKIIDAIISEIYGTIRVKRPNEKSSVNKDVL